jgi:hypothetical protein
VEVEVWAEVEVHGGAGRSGGVAGSGGFIPDVLSDLCLQEH